MSTCPETKCVAHSSALLFVTFECRQSWPFTSVKFVMCDNGSSTRSVVLPTEQESIGYVMSIPLTLIERV